METLKMTPSRAVWHSTLLQPIHREGSPGRFPVFIPSYILLFFFALHSTECELAKKKRGAMLKSLHSRHKLLSSNLACATYKSIPLNLSLLVCKMWILLVSTTGLS